VSTLVECKKGPEVKALSPLEPAVARERLAELVELYFEGQSRPLPFMPEPSRAHAEVLLKGKSPLEALHKAEQEYVDDPSKAYFDAHADLAFDHRVPPFDSGFEAQARLVEETAFHQLSLVVFRPLFERVSHGGVA
jgi:exonuclease V gamma subunit